jgi:hypothetical protein
MLLTLAQQSDASNAFVSWPASGSRFPRDVSTVVVTWRADSEASCEQFNRIPGDIYLFSVGNGLEHVIRRY